MNEVVEVVERGIAAVSTPRDFKDKKLETHTKAIEKLMNGVKKNMIEIAVRLREIKDNKLYEKDGYKDVFDYAQSVLDYKKTTVYKMIQTATKFIAVTPDGKGYVSIITRDGEDYSVSQLIELNALEPEEAIELDEANKIDPSMSTKDIREVVAEYKKQREPEEAEEPEEVDRTILAIKDIADNIDIALSDERFTKLDKDTLEDFKKWILSIEL